jgi:outer membrane protein assembly factor BamB
VAKSPTESYVVAHDLRTGRERWKTPRLTGAKLEECDAYTTPVVAQVDGKPQMIVMGGNQLDAYDPTNGRQLWFLPGIVGGRTVSSATVAEGMAFATQGKAGPLLAVKLGGVGQLPRSDIAWRFEKGTPDSSTPVAWADHFYAVTDAGIARCFDIHTGRTLWTERLKGDYKASPVAAEGRIYFLNTHGLCTVISTADQFDKLAENSIDDDTIASPALSDGRIYIRGHKALYCLGRD